MCRSSRRADTNRRAAGCWKHRDGSNRNGSYDDHVMAKRPLPSPEVLRQLLRYEPETGKLFWRERGVEWFKDGRKSASHNAAVWNARYAEKEAYTCVGSHGYKSGAIFDRGILAHRAIWAIQTGYWPENEIDHIDSDRLNNAFANLREATSRQNSWNITAHCDSLSGAKGVSRHAKGWRARIRVDGRTRCLGVFGTIADAAAAYDAAAALQHGEFARK